MPVLARSVVIGAAGGGLVGGIIGLIVGLHVYVPTAPFAVFELGAPGAIGGSALGLLIGVGLQLAHRFRA